jgi:hypothetical protein
MAMYGRLETSRVVHVTKFYLVMLELVLVNPSTNISPVEIGWRVDIPSVFGANPSHYPFSGKTILGREHSEIRQARWVIDLSTIPEHTRKAIVDNNPATLIFTTISLEGSQTMAAPVEKALTV